MRAHLLRTFYATPASEPDTGWSANDSVYAASEPSRVATTRIAFASTEALSESIEDEYALGGYAGI
jgi:hypothetical protein